MSKQPISVTLSVENLIWLRAQARVQHVRSVSELIDRLVSEVRTGEGRSQAPESVVGTVRISGDDPGLERADALVRKAVAGALRRGGRR